jgi:hypothetical protein
MRGRFPGEADPRGSRTRRARHAVLCAIAALAVLAPLAGAPMPQIASAAASGVRPAASCTGWDSETVPPDTIRVLRTDGPAQDTVQVVPFRDYVEVVMATEWGASNPTEALRAGAVAVKEYAWLKAMNWRGKKGPDGECYDVVDSTVDQVYAPEKVRPVPPTLTAAVDDSWGTTVTRDGHLFTTHYQGGKRVACGVDADGVWLFQNSAMACARDGKVAAEILVTYYGEDVTVAGGSGGPGPSPSPTVTPQPAATLTLSASATMTTWPSQVTLAATLAAPPGVLPGGRPVRIETSPDGVAWMPLQTVALTLDEAGAATAPYAPIATLRYRAVFDGAPDLPAMTSDPVRVVVRQYAYLRPLPIGTSSRIRPGTKIAFAITVRPARADAEAGAVTLEVTRLSGSTWQPVATKTAKPDAKGVARIGFAFEGAGTYRVRARAAATARVAASAWTKVQTWTVR